MQQQSWTCLKRLQLFLQTGMTLLHHGCYSGRAMTMSQDRHAHGQIAPDGAQSINGPISPCRSALAGV